MRTSTGEGSGATDEAHHGPARPRVERGVDLRAALLGKRGPLLPALVGVVVALLLVVIVLLVVGGIGTSAKGFTAKGMIRDHTGWMYDPADSPLADTEVGEFLSLSEGEKSCAGGDLDESSILTIADAEGKVLATGPLVFQSSLSKKSDDWIDRGYCGFTFEIPVESDSDFFRLTVSNTVDGIPPVERQKLIDGAEIQLSGGYR